MNKRTTLQFKTVILSDIHLGTPECRIDEVNHFLSHVRCERLILNGDIIDGWSLLRKGGWNSRHTRFVRLVLKQIEKSDTHVIYLRGNHDDLLTGVLPVRVHTLRLEEDCVLETKSGRYLVVRGDVFDVVTSRHRYLAVLGAIGYQGLLQLNRLYNRYRTWRGQEYFSLSQAIKARVKDAVNYIGSYETQLQALARNRGCVGVICGHIHSPADKKVGDIHYLNSGDWVESMTALVEHNDGRFEVLTYVEFRRRLQAAQDYRRSSRPTIALVPA